MLPIKWILHKFYLLVQNSPTYGMSMAFHLTIVLFLNFLTILNIFKYSYSSYSLLLTILVLVSMLIINKVVSNTWFRKSVVKQFEYAPRYENIAGVILVILYSVCSFIIFIKTAAIFAHQNN